MSVAKDASSGIHAATNTATAVSRRKLRGVAARPWSNRRHTIVTNAVPANAPNTPVVPYGQLNQMITWPPTSRGISGTLMSASRRRLATSHVATAIATATTPIHTSGT